jgi:ornithine cyclodeaminase/alanine dehydrogenase-like protein (mu-crystallin family)
VKTLDEDAVRTRLEPRRLVAAIEDAFRRRYPAAEMPVRTRIELGSGVFLVMPCHDRSTGGLGMKLVLVKAAPAAPDRPATTARPEDANVLRDGFDPTATTARPDGAATAPASDDTVVATYLLLDSATGRPRLALAAGHLTALRTAATSAVATAFLARPQAEVLGVVGTGRQARAHLELLPRLRSYRRLLVAGSDPGRGREFARRMSAELGAPVEAVDAAACAAAADVLCACTTAREPLFDGGLLRPGTHLNLVGGFQPDAREVDDVTVLRSRVVVDTYEGALAEAGDLLIPLRKGLIGRDHIIADLHELVSGKAAGRLGPADITLFKSVGCALEDLVAAELVE